MVNGVLQLALSVVAARCLEASGCLNPSSAAAAGATKEDGRSGWSRSRREAAGIDDDGDDLLNEYLSSSDHDSGDGGGLRQRDLPACGISRLLSFDGPRLSPVLVAAAARLLQATKGLAEHFTVASLSSKSPKRSSSSSDIYDNVDEDEGEEAGDLQVVSESALMARVVMDLLFRHPGSIVSTLAVLSASARELHDVSKDQDCPLGDAASVGSGNQGAALSGGLADRARPALYATGEYCRHIAVAAGILALGGSCRKLQCIFEHYDGPISRHVARLVDLLVERHVHAAMLCVFISSAHAIVNHWKTLLDKVWIGCG